MPVRVETAGAGYEFLPGLPFASNGVIASSGMIIQHAVFADPILFPEGFEAVRGYLDSVGRPVEALCGFDLRLPAARKLEDFLSFNNEYLAQLNAWGLLHDGSSPLARTNVAPVSGAPPRPAILGFSYTIDGSYRRKSFVVSGVPELPDDATGPQDIVRSGETSADALLEKLQFVVAAVAARVEALGVHWENAVNVHLYAAHDLAFPLAREVLAEQGIVPIHGITWHDAAPPVELLEVEVDVRQYEREIVLA
jgi:hypothetical protein